LHPHPYSSKFPPLPGKFTQQIRRALTKQRRRRAAGRDNFEFLGAGIGDIDVGGQGRRQPADQPQLQAELALPPAPKIGQFGLGFEHLP